MSSHLFTKADASDYITAKRQMAIATEFLNTTDTAPTKNNGRIYNKNFKFIPTQANDLSNCLLESASYSLRSDYTTGKEYINKKCN